MTAKQYWLTKIQKRVIASMWELQRPVSRDMLMSHIGRAVSSRAIRGLENDELVVRHESMPTLWTLTPAGECYARDHAVQ